MQNVHRLVYLHKYYVRVTRAANTNLHDNCHLVHQKLEEMIDCKIEV